MIGLGWGELGRKVEAMRSLTLFANNLDSFSVGLCLGYIGVGKGLGQDNRLADFLRPSAGIAEDLPRRVGNGVIWPLLLPESVERCDCLCPFLPG